MLRRNFYISHTFDYQVSSSELDFIEHLEDFNFMTLGHDDEHDQKVIDYYISHFDFLISYAFRLNAISDRRLYLKATSVFLADHPTIREQFHQKTHLDSFILRYPQKINEYKSESHAAFFDLLPRLIMTDDQKKIYPEFLQKSFFQGILENVSIQPAFDFLCNLPNIIPASLQYSLLNIEIPQMMVRFLKNDGKFESDESDFEDLSDDSDADSGQPKENKTDTQNSKEISENAVDDNESVKEVKEKKINSPKEIKRNIKIEQKIQRIQTLFIYYIKQRMITDIPAALMRDNSFQKIVQNAIVEHRPETFELIQFLMSIQNEHYPSNQWNDIYGIILDHFNDYCSVILNTKPFNLCSECCLNLICAITMSTRKLNDAFIEVFLDLSNTFFQCETIKDDQINQKKDISNLFFRPNTEKEEVNTDNKIIKNILYINHNSFQHNCYMFVVKLLNSLNLLSEDLIEKSSLPNRIVDFFLKKTPRMFASQTGQCMELFVVLDPIVSNLNLVDMEDWNKVKEIVDEKKAIISKPYGKPGNVNDNKMKAQNKEHGGSSFQHYIFILLFIFLIAFLIKFIN